MVEIIILPITKSNTNPNHHYDHCKLIPTNPQVVALVICFVLAVIANLGIAVCALRYREMRTPTNLCLVNLAAADLLFALGVPAVAYTRLTQSWRLGDAVCRMLPYSQVRDLSLNRDISSGSLTQTSCGYVVWSNFNFTYRFIKKLVTTIYLKLIKIYELHRNN